MIFIRTCPICYEGFYLIHRNSKPSSAIQWDIDTERHIIGCRLMKAILKPYEKKVLVKSREK